MVNTSSKPKSPSFAISYGFLGGPLNSRLLRKKLKETGYVETSLDDADIIIAHSGGTYMFDWSLKPKLVLLTAPALTREDPRKSFNENLKQLWGSAMSEHYIGKRLLWSLYGFYCGLRHPKQNYKMIKLASDTKFKLPEFKNTNVLFITNKTDIWPRGLQLTDLLADRSWTFISLPGAHEHIWVHPEDYIDIINLYA